MSDGDSFVQFIRSTMSPAQIFMLCAILLRVDVDTLRAWVARCQGGQNR